MRVVFNVFEGTFDGQNHTISNLSYSDVESVNYGSGFFHTVGSATIKNVTFDAANIDNNNYNVTGIVAGYSYGSSTFENVSVKNSYIHGFGKVGGIIGMAAYPGDDFVTTFNNCPVSETTVQAIYNAGGLAGNVPGKAKLSGNAVNATFIPDGRLANYSNFDTEITCSENAKTCPGAGIKIKGNYWVNNGYYWGGYADFYIKYGAEDHDCVLKDQTMKLAQSENVHDAAIMQSMYL